MNLLIFLQNAYGVEEGYIPSYEHPSFKASHTGKRLEEMIPNGFSVFIRNASQLIGETSDSCYPPNPDYMMEQIRQTQPNIILVCGEIARKGLYEMLNNSALPSYVEKVVFAPHPAYRALTKKKTLGVAMQIVGLS